MNLIIPFIKDVKFKTNIGEIVSISLEHEYTVNDKEILGNFIISGDYKTHEVSVNKEYFEHVLPFKVELNNKIDTNTVDFSVEDFTYEVIDPDVLRVNIEYLVDALEIKEEEKCEEFEELLDEIDRDTEEEKEALVVDTNTVIDSVSNKEDVFVTYNIHVMMENETIDSICLKYNTKESVLKEYNDLNNINIGDKIIIPDINE